MNNIQIEKQNKRYRRKYKFIKIRIKSLLLVNILDYYDKALNENKNMRLQ